MPVLSVAAFHDRSIRVAEAAVAMRFSGVDGACVSGVSFTISEKEIVRESVPAVPVAVMV